MSASYERKNTDDFVNAITSELMDESLQTRFGTSLQVNMGREYQKILVEKYRELHKEFKRINKDPRDGITVDELLDFLNTNEDLVNIFVLKLILLS